MAELPHYFELERSAGATASGLHPFSYDHENRMFEIDGEAVELRRFDPYYFGPIDIGLDLDGIGVADIPHYPALLPNFGSVIAGPKLHEWADDHAEAVNETYKIIGSAYTTVSGDNYEMTEEDYSHMGFSSKRLMYGGILFQTVGSCACLGPDQHGMLVYEAFDNNYAEYILHNAETRAQRVSLYAGIGHLARLAALDIQPEMVSQDSS